MTLDPTLANMISDVPEGDPENHSELDENITPKNATGSDGDAQADDKAKFVENLMKQVQGAKEEDDDGTPETELQEVSERIRLASDTDDVDDTGDDTTKDADDDIPKEFTSAALAAGFTEQQIIDFAKQFTNDELLELIPTLNTPAHSEPEPDKDSAVDQKVASENSDEDKDLTEREKKLLARIEALEGKQKEYETQTKEQELEEAQRICNEMFDNEAKSYKIFGETDKLPVYPAGPRKGQLIPTPAVKARFEVLSHAALLCKGGMNIKDAMQDSLTWYKGKNLQADFKDNVVKQLKRSATKLSPKRQGAENTKVYQDEESRREALVKELARKAGVKGEFGN